MNDLPASHYLSIYEHRLSMAERGITKPSSEVVADVRTLVSALRNVDPSELITLKIADGYSIFILRSTGDVIGRITMKS